MLMDDGDKDADAGDGNVGELDDADAHVHAGELGLDDGDGEAVAGDNAHGEVGDTHADAEAEAKTFLLGGDAYADEDAGNGADDGADCDGRGDCNSVVSVDTQGELGRDLKTLTAPKHRKAMMTVAASIAVAA